MKKFFFVVWCLEAGYQVRTMELNEGEQIQNFPRDSVTPFPFSDEILAYKYALEHANTVISILKASK